MDGKNQHKQCMVNEQLQEEVSNMHSSLIEQRESSFFHGFGGIMQGGELNVMASSEMMTDQVIPGKCITDYQTIPSMPMVANKILTGTMLMTDPNSMTQMAMFERKSLIPESMMQIGPMYGDMKAMQGRGYVNHQIYPLRSMVTESMMPTMMAAPKHVPPTISASVNTNMMTGITMISGKPLSGRVMVGDARAVTSRNMTSEKISSTKAVPCVGTSFSKNINVDSKSVIKGSSSGKTVSKPPTNLPEKQQLSKLSQIDKMTAARIHNGEKNNSNKQFNENKSLITQRNVPKSPTNQKVINCVGINDKLSPLKSLSFPKIKKTVTEKPSNKKQVDMSADKSLSGKDHRSECDSPCIRSNISCRSPNLFRSNSLDRKLFKKSISMDRPITPRAILGDKNTLQETMEISVDNTAKCAPKGNNVVHWFRRGLRLHDNPALKEALKNCATFRCIYILDPWFAGSSNVGVNKWRFLLQCLNDLDNSLRNLNSRLFVVRGQPANALPQLFKEWDTNLLTFEEDPEPFGKARDARIIAIADEMGIQTIVPTSHTLYKLDKIIEKKGGKPPLTYKTFQNILTMIDPPSSPVAPVTSDDVEQACTPLIEDHDDKYGVPNLEDLGFETDHLPPAVWKGGETEALSRLKHHLERKAWVASFGRPKMTPQSLFACPTGLSPYLRFGCLSARKFYTELNELYRKIKKVPAPVSLHGQLLWREFFYTAATNNPKFDHMKGNPICVQIPWDKNPEALAKWAHGQTGFPWIDAIMTQLRNEGWIHNVARHAVACFLTRGDLWVSWEEGMKVFDELLLDADWSVNAGSWMWLSCSSFFQQFFHCYCPVRYGRKADPNGDFIRMYLPVLKNFPTKYIHEPWLAPESVQRTARCVVGQHYPLPIVDHTTQSQTNIERMKQVYQQLAHYRGNLRGNASSPGPCSHYEKSRRQKGSSSPAPAPRNLPLRHKMLPSV